MHHYTIEEAAYLAEVVDSSDDAIITKTLKSVIRTWNPAAERIFGYTAQEAVGQSVLLIIPSGLQHEENIILTRIRNGERLEHFDTVRLRKDGRLIDVSLTVSPVRDPKGVIIGASKIARDITERKKTEQALAELHSRLTVTLASIGDAVVATDVDSHVTYVNPAAENLLGYSSPLLVGRPLREIFHIINAYTRRRVDSPVDEVLRRGVIVGLANHTVLMRPDGKEIPIADSAAPIKDALGRCLGVVLVFRDISDQYKAARQAVLLSAIVANSDDAIISKDLRGTITSWNRGAEQIFGFTAEEIVGSSILRIIPDDRQAEEQDILTRVGRGERIDHYETIRRRKDGRLCTISLTVSPLMDESGTVVGISKIARDITKKLQ